VRRWGHIQTGKLGHIQTGRLGHIQTGGPWDTIFASVDRK
jgi:hypothetical protein